MNANFAERRIHLLPEHLIDQIKAGEVIERPANIIKETLENAIDANADVIKIHLIAAGLELIHIEDNGNGISYEDLPFAFCRHATSKITKFEDLYHLYSFGFRGEALASISAISKVSCYSSTKFETSLFQMEGAQTTSYEKLTPTGQTGTSLFIRDLFYNTPVRMKFLQSGSGEISKLKKTISSFLLTRPDIEFHVKWDQQDKVVYPKTSLAERFKLLLGEKKGHEIKLYLHQEQFDNYHLQIYFSQQTQKATSQREQFIFINHRNVIEKQIHNLLLRVLEPVWGNEQGSYCLFLTLPPEEIDVNVHPNKTIIKIHQNSKLLAFIGSSLKRFLQTKTKLTEQINQTSAGTNSINPQLTFDQPAMFKDLHKNPLTHTTRTIHSISHESHHSFFKLNEKYGIFKHERWYLVQIPDLLLNWIKQFAFKEYESIPQMVSWPFRVTKEVSQLDEFKTLSGIELDQLDNNTVVLRSLPSYLKDFDYQTVIEHFLSINTLPKTLEEYFDQLSSIKMALDQSQDFIMNVILSFPIESLGQQSFIKIIDKSLLDKIFKK